ncbi:hypothetical protein, partial [Pseudonocardia charpentierae]
GDHPHVVEAAADEEVTDGVETADRGHMRLVAVSCAQVGDGNRPGLAENALTGSRAGRRLVPVKAHSMKDDVVDLRRARDRSAVLVAAYVGI